MNATLTGARRASQSSLQLVKGRVYMGKILGAACRKQKSLRKCFHQKKKQKTIVPATVSYSRSALVCSIIGWGFRWKGTAGEKAFFWRGEMVLVRGRKALFSGPQWEIGTGEESHRD